jgi:hypothetical protein
MIQPFATAVTPQRMLERREVSSVERNDRRTILALGAPG